MAQFLGGSFLGPPVIVRLFPRRFFLGPMMVNGMGSIGYDGFKKEKKVY